MDPKQISRTSFCNKEIDNVTDNQMKEYILSKLKLKTGVTFQSRYAKIYNEKFSQNLNNPHIVCIKSSGTPYLLFCTQVNNTNYCFLIDKKVKDGYEYPKIFVVHYRFDPNLFKGTLFETELIRDDNHEWSLLIGDIYCNSGTQCKQVQIHERVNQITDILENKYLNDSFCDICPIKVKKYFDIQDINLIMNEFSQKLTYKIRGLYFVPLKPSYSKILYLFKENDYKQTNSKKKQTVSFRILKTPNPDIYELYLQNEQKTDIVKHSYASITSLEVSKWVKQHTETNDEAYVNCSLHPIFKKWCPISVSSFSDTVIDV